MTPLETTGAPVEAPAQRPRGRDDLDFRQVGEEYLAYDAEKDHLVLLSPTAAAILALADAERTASEIADALAAGSGLGERAPETLRADVEEALRDLDAQGFLAN